MSRDHLSLTFAALADPTRRAMLQRLSRGESSVTELAKPFKISLPAISRHLKVLHRAGLIARGKQAQWRPCRMESAKMSEAMTWIDDCRKEWDLRLDRLEDYLNELQKKAPDPTKRGD